jgi:hypothetical protein
MRLTSYAHARFAASDHSIQRLEQPTKYLSMPMELFRHLMIVITLNMRKIGTILDG